MGGLISAERAGPGVGQPTTVQVSLPFSRACRFAPLLACAVAGLLHLGAGRVVVGRAVDLAEDARDGVGEVLVGQPGQRERQRRVGSAAWCTTIASSPTSSAFATRTSSPPDHRDGPRRTRRRCRTGSARRRRAGSAAGPRLVALAQDVERAVVEDRAVLEDLDQRRCRGAAAAWRSTSVRPLRSESSARPTNVASAPRASETGLNGASTEPIGVDLVTLPTSEVGEYWPLVSP